MTEPDSDGVPGREVVSPSDGKVLLPLPDHPGQRRDRREAADDDDLHPEVHRGAADGRLATAELDVRVTATRGQAADDARLDQEAVLGGVAADVRLDLAAPARAAAANARRPSCCSLIVVALLLFVIFPAIEQYVPINDVTVPASDASDTPILVVDNYDSFVYNLVQYLGQFGAEVVVRRNDAVTPAELDALAVDGVLVSPGPGTPADAGVDGDGGACAERALPLLGVCLGHQAIGAVSAPRSSGRRNCCTARRARSCTTGRACSPGCPRRSPRRATTRWRSSRTRCRRRSW